MCYNDLKQQNLVVFTQKNYSNVVKQADRGLPYV